MRERTNEVEVERDVKITVSDGTVLLTDVYHPVGVDDAPTILERTPYGRVNFASAMGPEFACPRLPLRPAGVSGHGRIGWYTQLLRRSGGRTGHRRLDRLPAVVQRQHGHVRG